MSMREVGDAAGVQWTIYEVRPSPERPGAPRVQATFSSGWLCFQCESGKRRLAGIPVGWSTLDDGALIALMSTAAPVVPGPAPRRMGG